MLRIEIEGNVPSMVCHHCKIAEDLFISVVYSREGILICEKCLAKERECANLERARATKGQSDGQEN